MRRQELRRRFSNGGTIETRSRTSDSSHRPKRRQTDCHNRCHLFPEGVNLDEITRNREIRNGPIAWDPERQLPSRLVLDDLNSKLFEGETPRHQEVVGNHDYALVFLAVV